MGRFFYVIIFRFYLHEIIELILRLTVNMKYLLLIISLLFFSCSSINKERETTPTKEFQSLKKSFIDGLNTSNYYQNEEIYKFMKSIVNENSTEIIHMSIAKGIYQPVNPTIDTTKHWVVDHYSFDEDDYEFLINQKKSLVVTDSSLWDLEKLGVIDKYIDYTINCLEKRNKSVVYFGLPLFNKNKDRAIIYYIVSHGICSSNGYSKYKLLNEKWVNDDN